MGMNHIVQVRKKTKVPGPLFLPEHVNITIRDIIVISNFLLFTITGGASSQSLVKNVLFGKVYQFSILEHIGDFLLDKKIKVRHPLFLDAVCKMWKRLLQHRRR
jgi:hypothetical protein